MKLFKISPTWSHASLPRFTNSSEWELPFNPLSYPIWISTHLKSCHTTSSGWKSLKSGGPRVVVSTAALHASVRGSVPGLGGFKETKNVPSLSTCKNQYCGRPPSPRGSVSSQSSHHPQEVLMAQFSLYMAQSPIHLITLRWKLSTQWWACETAWPASSAAWAPTGSRRWGGILGPPALVVCPLSSPYSMCYLPNSSCWCSPPRLRWIIATPRYLWHTNDFYALNPPHTTQAPRNCLTLITLMSTTVDILCFY